MTRGEDGTRERPEDVLLMPKLQDLLKDFGETIKGAILTRTDMKQMKLWTDLGSLDRLSQTNSAIAAKCKSVVEAVSPAVRCWARMTHKLWVQMGLLGHAQWASCLSLLLRSSSWPERTTSGSLRSWRC
jgi:hypothetical protein